MDSIIPAAPKGPRPPDHHLEAVVAFERSTCLLVAGWIYDHESLVESVLLRLPTGDYVVDSSMCWYPRPDVAHHFGDPPTERNQRVGFWVLTAVAPRDLVGRLQIGFVLKDGSRCNGEQVEISQYSPRRYDGVRGLLAMGSIDLFRDVLEVRPHPVDLLKVLASELPPSGTGIHLRVEQARRLPDGGVFLAGSLYTEEVGLQSLTLIDESSGASVDFLEKASFFHRDDFANHEGERDRAQGFAATVDLEGSAQGRELAFYFQTTKGGLFRLPVDTAPCDMAMDRRAGAFLGVVPDGLPRKAELIRSQVGPALARAMRIRTSGEAVTHSVRFGAPPHKPEVTIAVLLGDDPNALRYQLAMFCDDPDFERADLVYVPRSPSMAAATLTLARSIQPHFRVPFRVLDGVHTSSPAEAINLSARAAEGKMLLLMSGDALPAARGWLSALRAAFSRPGDAAAVGPRLLSEDGTLYQGPTYLVPSHLADDWCVDDCPTRGFPPALVSEGDDPVAVEALSLDCLLVPVETLLDVGGVPEDYLFDGFADLELCCRLGSGGRKLYYVPSVSIDLPGRKSIRRFEHCNSLVARADWYNCWVFNERRKELLQKGSA